MATATDIRTRVYETLYSAFPLDRPFESQLDGAITNVATTITVNDGDDWDEGDILEVVTTGEQCLVLSKAGNILTVERSYGSIDGTAASDNDRIRKNPRFTQDQLDSAMTEALNSMETWGIHGYATGTFNLTASQWFYELSDTDIDAQIGVLSIYYVEDVTKEPVPLPFTQQYHLSTADVDWSEGRGVKLYDKGDRATTDPVYYTYAQSLEFDTDLDTTIAKALAPQEELISLATVSRLLGGTIIPMTQDPGQRTDRTVAPGQTTRDVRYFQGEFFIKVRAEAARLAVDRQRLPRARRTARAKRWKW